VAPDPIPAGWHTVTPRIVARDPATLVEFIKEVFEARGDFHADVPSEIQIGDSRILISGAGPRDVMTAFLYVYVDDADETYRRALTAGAVSLEKPRDLPYGDRRGMVKDRWGNVWQIATSHRSVPEIP
jgi:uncharacterized glyoxalase superfamily protein PhnB